MAFTEGNALSRKQGLFQKAMPLLDFFGHSRKRRHLFKRNTLLPETFDFFLANNAFSRQQRPLKKQSLFSKTPPFLLNNAFSRKHCVFQQTMPLLGKNRTFISFLEERVAPFQKTMLFPETCTFFSKTMPFFVDSNGCPFKKTLLCEENNPFSRKQFPF